MPRVGVPELLVILVIVIVIFGATKLPQLGKGLGEGIRNFRKGLRGDDGSNDQDGKENGR
ncbi:MAG TPA: twin-arginine translocase TatA/TatE family subunit [Thermoanaerobaculia bacterium]|nr:twin-arginine translocase TatA/TatE family subunit [Thermoanaerobaculia bacterium]MDI9631045.1 twin-arginine translocase TatA/TatE family subunit [Acidobacteriota bacterium]OQC42550.1 MAG: Sec-independent protein translocase protein TatAy [Acidobacteria bacterium ADurb.Bin051]MBP7813466.1 twin-arginine translocase TatA/TatE family subunit [Thermoanaerobaculia bacterium]MBP8845449.1 twin-arginine translocase TatA/TatE family subunit [Thermoanaerobaculia bacterium]